jgi:tetratricopeptide (TPR) repeat protein
MKGRVFVASMMIAVVVPATALAQQPNDVERAKASFKAGATAYAAGEYLAAIQALEAAYALTPVPAIAFSLAQAERKQYFVAHEREHLDRALALFRRYVEQTPTGGRRADALDALSQLESIAATQTGVAGRTAGASEATRRTRLMITSETPGAQISLDGGPPVPSPLIREVEAGKHRVEVTAEGYFPEQHELGAVAGELIPDVVTLRERPSALVISTSAGAEIYVDGAFARRGGEQITLELPSGAHRLAVAEKGHQTASREVELLPGKSENLRFTLQSTRQRHVAVALFVSGAAALGTGAVFGVLTLRAEQQAKDFLSSQAQGNVTREQLSEYDDDVANRNRFRIATAVSLASAVGLGMTAFFLYELDQPSSEQLHRASSPSSRLRFAPVATPGNVGASVVGSF